MEIDYLKTLLQIKRNLYQKQSDKYSSPNLKARLQGKYEACDEILGEIENITEVRIEGEIPCTPDNLAN